MLHLRYGKTLTETPHILNILTRYALIVLETRAVHLAQADVAYVELVTVDYDHTLTTTQLLSLISNLLGYFSSYSLFLVL